MDKMSINKWHVPRWVILLLLLWAGNLGAVEVENLFTVQMPVTSQANSERNAAVLRGLKEVLVRKSGSESVLQSFEVLQALPKATSYLQRFEYQALPEPIEQILPDGSRLQYAFSLTLSYDPVLVENLIKSAGAPVWGLNRPMVLLWIAVEDQGQRYLVSEDQQLFSEAEQIGRESQRRAVPLLLPLNDLEDQTLLQFSDVWGRFVTPIRQASARYGADVVVAGKVQQVAGAWQGKFVYLNDDIETVLDIEAGDKSQVFTNLVNQLAELMCQKYCVTGNATNEQLSSQILVGNVNGFANFKKVQQALQKISAIRKAELKSIDGHYALFRLVLLGEKSAVIEALKLSRELIAMSEEDIKSFEKRGQETPEEVQINGNDSSLQSVSEAQVEALINQPQQQTQVGSETAELQPTKNKERAIEFYYWWRP